MNNAYALVVVLAAGAHFAFIAYMVVGGFLALRWPRTIWLHVPVVIWGIAIELIDFVCPLTWLERWARAKAGMAPMPVDGFIDYYLTGVVYPESAEYPVLALALLTVLVSWALFARRRRTSTQNSGDRARQVSR
ncbi:DUF2784 domain-containing protein [Mycobacterium sp. URHB0044]|jgi:hypothetical protein|uniref:DUF2784 domain-containing protein n=1 Tax=Mycobacterium sp. URHB0044 TaxID=1380386 RepID=UPI00055E7366|nr:DUF2784 domain-containing protein [Mycobacterium sp. URHB0044]